MSPRRVGAAALVWLALLGAACGEREREPLRVARQFAAAVVRRDAEALVPLLARSAVRRLEAAAERASNQVGGRRNLAPAEMIQVVDVPPTFQVAKVRLVEEQEGWAHVRIEDAKGQAHDLRLVREDDDWKVQIPLPEEAP